MRESRATRARADRTVAIEPAADSLRHERDWHVPYQPETGIPRTGALGSGARRQGCGPTPRTIAWVASENAVAPPTKAIASGPAFSCTQRERPRWVAAAIGSELPAMKPATQASAWRASTRPFRKRT